MEDKAGLVERLKEKSHIIVITIITLYLIALAIKTGHVFYEEYWAKSEPAAQSQTAAER